jgi:hypothetical protein
MSTPLLWIVWLAVVVLTGAVALVPTLYGPRTTDSTEAGLEVMQFVLALLSITAAVGSLAVRESVLRGIWRGDYRGGSRDATERLGRALLGAWVLCLVIAGLGTLLAWFAADPARSWPYLLAAAVLLVYHAPRPGLLASTRPE